MRLRIAGLIFYRPQAPRLGRIARQRLKMQVPISARRGKAATDYPPVLLRPGEAKVAINPPFPTQCAVECLIRGIKIGPDHPER
jgi:hypothetical protein